jgi:lysophospholipid acyltransferase (LPLAT)-like uncharacterized protein
MAPHAETLRAAEGSRPKRKKLSRRILERLAVALGAVVFRLLAWTWRLTIENEEAIEGPRRRGERVVYAFWHNRMLAFVRSHRGRGVAVMVSRHGDGEIIARLIEKLGFATVRGSTTRGGAAALRGLVARAAEADVAVTPDGPRGPRYRLQPGIVLLASLAGRRIVYGSYACARAWRFGSWDRFMVPKPFARVVIRAADPLAVAPGLDERGLEEARRDLEGRLRRVTAELDREVAGEVDPLLLEAPAAAPLCGGSCGHAAPERGEDAAP